MFVSAATLCLLIAGGLVTSTGSALSVPDWPLSYGRFFPPMIGGIRFEHTHRVIAACVGILTFFLAFFVFKWEKRIWVKGFALSALFAVVLQAILGGLTVKYLLPTAVSVGHACLGQTFFCLVASLWLFNTQEWLEAPHLGSENAKSIQHLSLTTFIFVYIQLIIGAFVRHTGGHGIRLHFVLAFLILVHVLLIVLKIAKDESLGRKLSAHAALLGALTMIQLFLGFGSFVFKMILEKSETPRLGEVLFTTAHQTNGALILAASWILTLRSYRLYQKAGTVGKSSSFISDYVELLKPRLTLLAVATTLLGFVLASKGPLHVPLLFHALFASFLIGGGANVLNQYLERDIDAKMKRTRMRPLPSGKLDPQNVFVFGATLSTIGVLEFFFFVNLLTTLLGLAALLSYVFCYTPLKRKTYFNTFVGAVSGALPSVMGWTAARGELGTQPLMLFILLFVWQLPHFFAIAWVHREDYERSGLCMLSLGDKGGGNTARHILFYAMLLVPVSLMPALAGMSGQIYFFSALSAGLGLVAFAFWMQCKRLAHADKFVSASIYYLLFIISFMIADKL